MFTLYPQSKDLPRPTLPSTLTEIVREADALNDSQAFFTLLEESNSKITRFHLKDTEIDGEFETRSRLARIYGGGHFSNNLLGPPQDLDFKPAILNYFKSRGDLIKILELDFFDTKFVSQLLSLTPNLISMTFGPIASSDEMELEEFESHGNLRGIIACLKYLPENS